MDSLAFFELVLALYPGLCPVYYLALFIPGLFTMARGKGKDDNKPRGKMSAYAFFLQVHSKVRSRIAGHNERCLTFLMMSCRFAERITRRSTRMTKSTSQSFRRSVPKSGRYGEP